MKLQQRGLSYGHLRQMQSTPRAVQLTKFCVKKQRKVCSSFKKML